MRHEPKGNKMENEKNQIHKITAVEAEKPLRIQGGMENGTKNNQRKPGHL